MKTTTKGTTMNDTDRDFVLASIDLSAERHHGIRIDAEGVWRCPCGARLPKKGHPICPAKPSA